MAGPFVHASDYPQTRDEQEAEEMGSLVNGGGISLSPKPTANTSTTSVSVNNNTHVKFNAFLWNATLNVLDFIPIASLDSNSGIIITDWYSTHKEPNYSFKVHVKISGNTISPENIDIKIYERKLSNGQWYNQKSSHELKYQFEEKILRKARDLFQHSNKAK
jgi:hypothetical protein